MNTYIRNKISFLCILLFVSCSLACYGKELKIPLTDSWWRYNEGKEFPGALGKLTIRDGVLRLEGNFRNGGDYVMAELGKNLRLPCATALRVEARTNGDALTARVLDGSGKMHQYRLPVKPGEDWQQIDFPFVFSECSWGGPDCRRFDSSAIQFMGLLVRAESSINTKCSFLEIKEIKLIGLNDASSNHYLAPELNPESLLVSPGDELRIPVLGVDEEISYTLKNYSGEIVGKGFLSCKDNEVRLHTPTTEGYYDLALADDEISFIVAKPFQGMPDPYWGADESFSWWSSAGDFRRNYIRFLVKSGISWGRDRIQWSALHPERDKMALQNGDYEKILGWSAQEGLQVLDVFHDTPSWNKKLLSKKGFFDFSTAK